MIFITQKSVKIDNALITIKSGIGGEEDDKKTILCA